MSSNGTMLAEADCRQRAQNLFDEQRRRIFIWNDRLLAGLLVFQWVAGIAIAFWISPWAWSGTSHSPHPHVWLAAIMGLVIVSVPAYLAYRRPGQSMTRQAIAVGEALMAALLIHLTGGRIESHFLIFATLALMAMYRDWRVLITMSLVVAADHLVRGYIWPQSVYGTATISSWRWVEHSVWVGIEDVFLILSCQHSLKEMWILAERQADLEAVNERIEGVVVQRTVELKSANKALETLYQTAQAATRAKSDFLANMSHEIRTPMSAILGYSELLLSPHRTPSERLDFVLAVRRNGEHLLELINDVLDLSKIEAGKLDTDRKLCSLQQVLSDVMSMMRPRAMARQLSFDLRCQGPIPEFISTDATRLRQILINLVGNALKFTKHGGVSIVCQLSTTPEDPQPKLRFDVTDTGIGMTADEIARLFQPFTQADSSTSRKFGGTGLGLVISKRLAEALGGSIDVSSTLGKGSIFSLTVETGPLKHVRLLDRLPDMEFSSPPMTHTQNAAPEQMLAGARILLAEDGPDNQFLISLHLSGAGARVEIAENGRIALERVQAAIEKQEPFDLILMDMQMPEMDGYLATRTLRQRDIKIPVIALTAHALSSDRTACLDAGCDDFASKPIQKALLVELVASHLVKRDRMTSVATPVRPTEANGADTTGPLFSELSNDPAMEAMILSYVSRLETRLKELRGAAQDSDYERLMTLAHHMKGAAGGYGYGLITDEAAVLEQLAKQQADAATIAQALDSLSKVCRRAQAVYDMQTIATPATPNRSTTRLMSPGQ